MLKGLIFDLDGTLADTATYHVMAWNEMAQSIGIKMTDDQINSLRGLNRKKAMALILQYGNAVDKFSEEEQAKLIEEKNQKFLQLIKNMSPADLYPGMEKLLTDAKNAGLKIALASNSKNAPKVVEHLGILDKFDVIVDPGKLKKRKPDPEIYITAQQMLGLKADEVITFEDSPKGVQAIKAAGQFAVGIGKKDWPIKPDYQVDDEHKLTLKILETKFN